MSLNFSIFYPQTSKFVNTGYLNLCLWLLLKRKYADLDRPYFGVVLKWESNYLPFVTYTLHCLTTDPLIIKAYSPELLISAFLIFNQNFSSLCPMTKSASFCEIRDVFNVQYPYFKLLSTLSIVFGLKVNLPLSPTVYSLTTGFAWKRKREELSVNPYLLLPKGLLDHPCIHVLTRQINLQNKSV